MGPDFLIIGAPKTGTTWLWRNLRAHPEVWTPPVKELHYFDDKAIAGWPPFSALSKKQHEGLPRSWWRYRKQFSRRLRDNRKQFSLEALKWDATYFLAPPSDRWYASLFSPGVSRGALCGEATPSYCGLEPVHIRRVKRVAPNAKIIFFLRNPIEASYSFAEMFFARIQGRPLHSIPEDELTEHFTYSAYAPLFDYTRSLNNWLDVYPREQVFVGFLEDISFAPGPLVQSLLRFLGLDTEGYRPQRTRKVHSGNVSEASLEVLRRLARHHREQLTELEKLFGGYCSFWLWCADWLLSNELKEPSSTIPYPMGESFLWETWTKQHPGQLYNPCDEAEPLRSRSLSEVTS